MNTSNLRQSLRPLAAFACNMLLAYSLFMIARIVFIAVNISYYPELNFASLMKMTKGALYFDTSALMYLNALYALMMLIPLHYKETSIWQNIAKWIFITFNSIALITNLSDCVYFQYTNRRTTATVFSEFANESNLAGIFASEIFSHWYLFAIGIFLIWALIRLYRKPCDFFKEKPVLRNQPQYADHKIGNLPLYYIIQTIGLAVFIPLCIGGMRGGLGHSVRPITISNANQYVDRPVETAIVLNTPFSIMRTFGKKTFKIPAYFADQQQVNKIYSPLHEASSEEFRPLNVVIFIMESFGREYIGALNKNLEEGNYKGYTPFLDSLIDESLTFEYSFANGRKSIDGMPSVLSGIPSFVEPFFLTPASLNSISGVAGELKKKGYHTSFFHGAPNGSMGFQAFSKASGFEHYYGKTEYNNDDDFDGKWAIWDEEFFQFYANTLSTFPQPFVSALFSASSHHPFAIPQKYKDVYPEESLPILKCVRYTDHALKEYFENARRQPWFYNTLFVITADHTNQTWHPEFQNESGFFSVPVIFYHPGSDLKGMKNSIAQQTDILPTVLSYLNYDKEYLAYGCDLLSTPEENTYAVNYLNGIYQYHKGDYFLQFDGSRSTGLYAFKSDPLLKENLIGKMPIPDNMENELKAIIQDYMTRMNKDMLTVR